MRTDQAATTPAAGDTGVGSVRPRSLQRLRGGEGAVESGEAKHRTLE